MPLSESCWCFWQPTLKTTVRLLLYPLQWWLVLNKVQMKGGFFYSALFLGAISCSAILVCPSLKAVDVFGNKLWQRRCGYCCIHYSDDKFWINSKWRMAPFGVPFFMCANSCSAILVCPSLKAVDVFGNKLWRRRCGYCCIHYTDDKFLINSK